MLLLLAACAPRPVPPSAGAVAPASTPAALYSDLSTQFAQQGDAAAAGRFAVKAGAAGRGDTLQPDDPAAILPPSTPPEARGELASNHAQLLAADTATAKRAMPEIAAQAMAYFDGWLAQSAAPHRGEMPPYKDGFQRALATLESVPGETASPPQTIATASSPPAPVTHAPPAPTVPASPAEPPVVVMYLVHFDWNRDTLNAEAEEVMQLVMTDLHNVDRYDLILNGHTDTSGSADYNLDLSMRRAQHVAGWLKQSGVPDSKITTYAFGDTDLKVQTGPNVRSAVNRRVEVVIE